MSTVTFDRSKYRKQSNEESQAEEEKVQGFRNESGYTKRNWTSLIQGTNIVRFFPAQLKSVSAKWATSLVVSWLEIEQEVRETGWKEGDPVKKEIKKSKVFNSRRHGGMQLDLVEEYIAFAVPYFTEQFGDNKEGLKKHLEPILDFKLGIAPKTSWVSFVKHIKPDKSAVRAYMEFSDGIKKQLNKLSQRQKGNDTITVDIYSHPDTGKSVQVIYDKNAKDKRNTYACTVLFDDEELDPITEEDLLAWEKLSTLEEMYENTFTSKDFAKQLEGLKRFDDKNKYGLFDITEWIEIVEKVQALVPPDKTEDGEGEEGGEDDQNDLDKTFSKEPGNVTAAKAAAATGTKKAFDFPSLEALSALNKEQIQAFAKVNEIVLEVKPLFTAEKYYDQIIGQLKSADAYADDVVKSLLDAYQATLPPPEPEVSGASKAASALDKFKKFKQN